MTESRPEASRSTPTRERPIAGFPVALFGARSRPPLTRP